MSTFWEPKALIWVQEQQAGNWGRFLSCFTVMDVLEDWHSQDSILKARSLWEFHPWLQEPLPMTREWVQKSLLPGLKSWGQCLVQRQRWNEVEVGLLLAAAPWLFLLSPHSKFSVSLLTSPGPFPRDHLYLNPLFKVCGRELRHRTPIRLLLIEEGRCGRNKGEESEEDIRKKGREGEGEGWGSFLSFS